MDGVTVVIVASFILAFKAVLVEGSEVAIIAVATVSRLGRKNVLVGVICGAVGSLGIFAIVREFYVLLPDVVISLVTGVILLYFSQGFWRGFAKYYFGKKDFRAKMKKMGDEVVEEDMAHVGAGAQGTIPFSMRNALPVMSITMTEGFEASLVLAAAGAFNLQWTAIGGGISLLLLVTLSIFAYDYLLRVPHWFLDLFAAVVLLSFGAYFLLTGALIALGIWS